MFEFLMDSAVIDWAWNVLLSLGLILMFAVAFYGWTSVMMTAVAEIDSYYGLDGSAYKRRKS